MVYTTQWLCNVPKQTIQFSTLHNDLAFDATYTRQANQKIFRMVSSALHINTTLGTHEIFKVYGSYQSRVEWVNPYLSPQQVFRDEV